MKASTARSTPDPPPSVDTFDQVREQWLSERAKFKGLVKAVENLKLAENADHARKVTHDRSRLDRLEQDLKEAFPNGLPRPRMLPDLIKAAENAVDAARPAYELASDQYEIARQAEAERVGRALQARYLEAIAGIGKALEGLNEALAAEEAVRAEFAAEAPQPTSALLPDLSSDLHRSARLDRWDSVAARWARHLSQIGFLK